MPCITSFLSSLRLHGGFIPPKRVPYYILPQGSVFYGTQAKTEEKKEGLHWNKKANLCKVALEENALVE